MRRLWRALAALSALLALLLYALSRGGPAAPAERPLLVSFLPETVLALEVGPARLLRTEGGWVLATDSGLVPAKSEAVNRLIESFRSARILRRLGKDAGGETEGVLVVLSTQDEPIAEALVGAEAPEGGTFITWDEGVRLVVGEDLWALVKPPGGTWAAGRDSASTLEGRE